MRDSVALAFELEGQSYGQLNLSGIIDRLRGTVQRIGRSFEVIERASRAAWRCGIFRAEIRRPIDCVEVSDVQRVGEIERFGYQLHTLILSERKSPREPQVHSTQIIAFIRIARLDSHA